MRSVAPGAGAARLVLALLPDEGVGRRGGPRAGVVSLVVPLSEPVHLVDISPVGASSGAAAWASKGLGDSLQHLQLEGPHGGLALGTGFQSSGYQALGQCRAGACRGGLWPWCRGS